MELNGIVPSVLMRKLMRSGVRNTPSMFDADALQTAAATFPCASEVNVMEDWIVDGRRHR
jgi:hypothetical protein